MQKFIKLSQVATYSDTRIKCSALTSNTYIGTDNLLQNKQGAEISNFTPSSGYTTEYLEGDILVSNIRPYLKKIWYADNNGGSSPDVLTIRPKNIYPQFLYYALFQDIFFEYAAKGCKGTKMPRGDKSQIMQFNIPNISDRKQRDIVDILSALDDKIELNNRINKQLEKIAKDLYNYWFVQFDFPDGNKRPLLFCIFDCIKASFKKEVFYA